jgi:hypothetical protein
LMDDILVSTNTVAVVTKELKEGYMSCRKRCSLVGVRGCQRLQFSEI